MAAARANASKRPQLQVQASAGEAAPVGFPLLTRAEEAVGSVLAAPDPAAKYEMLEWELECTRDAIRAVGVWGTVDAEFQEGRFFW